MCAGIAEPTPRAPPRTHNCTLLGRATRAGAQNHPRQPQPCGGARSKNPGAARPSRRGKGGGRNRAGRKEQAAGMAAEAGAAATPAAVGAAEARAAARAADRAEALAEARAAAAGREARKL